MIVATFARCNTSHLLTPNDWRSSNLVNEPVLNILVRLVARGVESLHASTFLATGGFMPYQQECKLPGRFGKGPGALHVSVR